MTYSTLEELRSLDGLEDSVYTDEMLLEGAARARSVIDLETGTSWTPTTITLTLDGNGLDVINTRRPFLHSVTSCTTDGASEDVSGWTARKDGLVVRDSGVFPQARAGANVVLEVVQDVTQYDEYQGALADISFCSRALARQYVLRLLSEAPDGALSVQNELGTVMMAQAGGRHGVTSLPEVNARLKSRNHQAPRIG